MQPFCLDLGAPFQETQRNSSAMSQFQCERWSVISDFWNDLNTAGKSSGLASRSAKFEMSANLNADKDLGPSPLAARTFWPGLDTKKDWLFGVLFPICCSKTPSYQLGGGAG